jgi:hypothetical protein
VDYRTASKGKTPMSSVARPPSRQRAAAVHLALAAGILAAVVLLARAGRLASERIVREYGYNTDSGVYEGLLAVAILPAGLLFLMAGVALRFGSRAGGTLHLVAAIWGGLTLAGLAMLALFMVRE